MVAVVRTSMYGNSSLAARCPRRIHLAGSFKSARQLDTEVAQYRRARLRRLVVEKNVVAGFHAEPTAPGATSRRTAANFRG